MIKQLVPAVMAMIVLTLGMLGHWRLVGNGDGIELLEEFADSIENVPKEFGNWVSEEQRLTPEEFARTNCKAYVSRIYRNTKTGEEVSIYLVTGTSRHITIHSPDWCYRGAGYHLKGNLQNFELPLATAVAETSANSMSHIERGSNPVFTTAMFEKEDLQGLQQLRIYWSYSDNGVWESAANAKMKFAWRPALFKLYIIAPHRDNVPLGDTANMAFAKEFLPLINQVLFEPQGPPSSPDEDTAVASL